MVFCGSKNTFVSHITMKEGEKQMFKGDSTASLVISKGKVILKLTKGNLLHLSDAIHVLDIRWNLVSISLLGNARVRSLFESNKVILTKNNVFMGKGY